MLSIKTQLTLESYLFSNTERLFKSKRKSSQLETPCVRLTTPVFEHYNQDNASKPKPSQCSKASHAVHSINTLVLPLRDVLFKKIIFNYAEIAVTVDASRRTRLANQLWVSKNPRSVAKSISDGCQQTSGMSRWGQILWGERFSLWDRMKVSHPHQL